MERSIRDKSDGLACCLILKREIMRKVILTELPVVLSQTGNAPILVYRSLIDKISDVRHGLDTFAVLLPFRNLELYFR